jgi:hypothetical protein
MALLVTILPICGKFTRALLAHPIFFLYSFANIFYLHPIQFQSIIILLLKLSFNLIFRGDACDDDIDNDGKIVR